MTKTPAQLDREITQAVLPPAIIRKWKAKVTAYKQAINKLEAGYSDERSPASRAGYAKTAPSVTGSK